LNILVTGGCGFIGVNLISRLLCTASNRVRVIDNLSVGTSEDLGSVCDYIETDRPIPNSNKVELWIGDIRNPELALEVAQGVDCIVHLAANTGVIPSIEAPRTDCETNVCCLPRYFTIN